MVEKVYVRAMCICKLCKRKFAIISNTHLHSHGWETAQYIKKFGPSGVGFPLLVSQLPPSDYRYKKWRESLKRRPPTWNTGHTKYTHPGVAKISATFKRKGIDNFAAWRREARKRGEMLSNWPPLRKNGDLAEVIGVVLGDGHIARFPRTERLIVASNANNPGFVRHYSQLLEKIFRKKLWIKKDGRTNCVRFGFYQRDISKRLGIPSGDRRGSTAGIPEWIWLNKQFLIRCLRGLYEAEASFSIHLRTSTYKFSFANTNQVLLSDVLRGIKSLGVRPHVEPKRITVSKKHDALHLKKLLKFRKY